MGNQSKPWTPKEDAYLLKHPSKEEAPMVARHLGRSIISINARRTRNGLAVSLAGASYRPIEYPGPADWSPTQGPPCKVCGEYPCGSGCDRAHQWADYTASAVPMTGAHPNWDNGYQIDQLQEII